MSGTLVLRGGLIVTEDSSFVGDVVLRDGKISSISRGPSPDSGGARVMDVSGKVVLPGAIDPHVHLNYPQGPNRIFSADDWLTGSVAAVCGGTTCLVDFVEAARGQSLRAALEERTAEAERQGCVTDFSFHMTLNRADEETLAEVPEVVRRGVTSFKMYTAYDGIRLRDSEIVAAMGALARCGGLPIVHAECHDLIMARLAECRERGLVSAENQPFTRPREGESEATHRVACLAAAARVPAGLHIVHVTSGLAVPTFKASEVLGLGQGGVGPLTGEVCGHHLALTSEEYSRDPLSAPDFVCAPPMRPKEDVEAMWEALKDGTLHFVVSDHCPFTSQQRRGVRRIPEFRNTWKSGLQEGCLTREAVPCSGAGKEQEVWFKDGKEGSIPPFWAMPGGVAGIETRVVVTWHEAVSVRGFGLQKFAELVSTAAAKRYGLYPRKGALRVGSDADVLVMDPDAVWTISASRLNQNTDVCPFEGMKVKGAVHSVIVGGDVLVRDGKLVSVDHKGSFLPRKVVVS